jgi:uncharacterized protein
LSGTAPRAERTPVYADASALVKLILREPESDALRNYLGGRSVQLTSSRLAMVEVTRAVKIARPTPDAVDRADHLLGSCVLIDVTASILRAAAQLAVERLRTLDAVHLASIVHAQPDEVLAYDRRLASEARALGYVVAYPGAEL